MKYICLFDTEAEYEAKKDELAVPNVSYCKDTDKIKLLSEHVVDFNGDAEVERICLANWDSDGDGKLSFEEAAAVTAIGTKFRSNNKIVDLRCLKYFTKVTSTVEGAFGVIPNLIYIGIPSSITNFHVKTFTGYSGTLQELHLYWTNLSGITIGGSLPATAFPDAERVVKVIIPKGTLAMYEAHAATSKYVGKFEERAY